MIIFFIRRYNDIDHIVPVIYKFATLNGIDSRNEIITVLCLNYSFDIYKDFRLHFLMEECRVPVKYVYEYFQPTLLHRLASRLLCHRYMREKTKSLLSFFHKNNKRNIFLSIFDCLMCLCFYLFKKYIFIKLNLYENYLKPKVFNEKWALGLLKKASPRILVFDVINKYQYVAAALIDSARKLNIPVIALPHGMTLAIDYHDDAGDLDIPDFDAIVVQNRLYKRHLVNKGIDARKIHILGSARFCREWIDILHKISKDVKFPTKSDKLKVVFMDRLRQDRSNKDEVISTINKIGKLEFVDLIIKPHTRSNRLSYKEIESTAHIAYNIDSFSLCSWADVIMGTMSSILIEAHCQNKVLLYPKYFYAYRMIFDEMNACYTVNNHEELEEVLLKIKENPNYRPYPRENVEKFMTEIVYGGKKGRDVLGDYADFILTQACDL